MSILILLYILITLTHFILQTIFAVLDLKKRSESITLTKSKVLILTPTYNESQEILNQTILSVFNAVKKLNSEVYHYVVDDGSKTKVNIKNKDLGNYHIRFIEHQKNLGKREAHNTGFCAGVTEAGDFDYVVTIDSDAVLDSMALAYLIRDIQPKDVGALTANVGVKKTSQNNLLQKIVALRYFLAFNQERASQSFFGEVLCCCGVLSIYKFGLFKYLLPKYVNQKFLNKACTFGDDRHLTNLVLGMGYKVKYSKEAECYTDCPDNLKGYIKQQYRWCKSFFREALISLRIAIFTPHRINLYALWEVFVGVSLPLLLLINLVFVFVKSFENPIILINYLIIICLVAIIRSIYGIIFDNYNPKIRYLFFILFALMNLLILLPVRVYALFTINKTKWGTR